MAKELLVNGKDAKTENIQNKGGTLLGEISTWHYTRNGGPVQLE